MYGLNKNENLDFLLKKTLTGSHWTAPDYFNDDLSISIECKIEIKSRDFESIVDSSKETHPLVGANIVGFLGEDIERVGNLGDGNLHLTFSSEKELILYDTSHNMKPTTLMILNMKSLFDQD